MRQSSRSEADLAPELVVVWHEMQAKFLALHPSLPQPFLTQTYRSPEDQNADYAKGRTAPGKVITNSRAGQSLHNYWPSFAFDVAFKDSQGNIAWSQNLFDALGQIGLSLGIGWGGLWLHFKDYPHYQPLNYTWEMAANHEAPHYPQNLQA